MFVAAAFFDEPELHGRAVKVPFLAELAFHIAFVTPVEEFGVGAENFEGGCGVVVFLYHVVEFGGAVFEAGGWVRGGDAGEPVVELGSRYARFAVFGNLKDEVEDFGDVLAGDAAGKNERCPGHELKGVGYLRCKSVAGIGVFAFYAIPLADDDDEAFACFGNHTRDFLVETST